jgi:hypothetical protein
MTHERFFEALGAFNPLRVISGGGPSTFEAICRFGFYRIAGGYMNAITPEYHWHIELSRFGHLRTKDEVHERSGRRVHYFELRERATREPFLLIYLYRGPNDEFDEERERRFAALNAELAGGCEVVP